MTEPEFLGLLVLAVAIGLLTGVWWSLLVPAAASVAYYLGLEQAWWGCCGAGEAWVQKMIFFGLLFAGATGVGVGVRKVSRRVVRA